MLYLYHHIQIFAISSLVYVSLLILGRVFDRKGCSLFITSAMVIIFHASMLFLSASVPIYILFHLAILHYWIHETVSFRTIPETKSMSCDEVWHPVHQILSSVYLWHRGYDYRLYWLYMIPYLFLAMGGWFSKDHIVPLYYLASFMEAVFLLSIRSVSVVLIVPLLAIHMAASYLATVPDGRILLHVNIAGCVFVSEVVALYLMENGFY